MAAQQQSNLRAGVPTETHPEPLVELQNLQVYFPVRKGFFGTKLVKAVDGVSLTVQRGEVVAIVGESGSGKTTLGRAALGLLKPTAGTVFVRGQRLSTLGAVELKAFRRRAQVIFQDPFATIDPYMTIYESVAEPLVIHGIGDETERRRRVLQALRDVRLTPAEEIAGRYPHMLSGGQRQRAGIARALVLEPEYILADEPVSMVDASSRAEVLYLLRELRTRFDITFLYITHDIATARHFAQRIVVMYLGRVVERGPAATIVDQPRHPYTQALIAAVPEPNPNNRLQPRAVLPGEPPDPSQAPAGCSFHPRCPAFMPGRCDVAAPALLEVEAGHWVSCYLYESESGSDFSENLSATDQKAIIKNR
ncbi:MAG: ABC transporter ATP-binding protein [Caldilineaceae bacterium]